MREKLDRLGLILALVIFFTLGLWNLNLPGLHYDEAREAGLNAMEILCGLPVTAFREAKIQIGSTGVPLMVQDYIGAINVFLSLPFLGALGISVEALRLYTLSIGAGILFLTWAVARKLGGPSAGVVAALLLATNPSFVFWNRQGIFVTNITALFLTASLLCGLRWWERGDPRNLYCLALLWGLGFYSKALFLWAIVGMIIWALPGLFRRHPSIKELALALLIFSSSLFPLLVFNLMTGGTISAVLENLRFSYYGVSNLSWWSNFTVRLKQLIALLKGDHLWYLGGIFSNPVALWAEAGFVLVSLILVLAQKVSPRTLLPAFVASLIVAESSFTISGLFITHYFFLLPLLAIAGGVGVSLSLKTFNYSWALKALVIAVFLLWAGTDLYIITQYHQALMLSGGHSAHSDAIYDLAHFLIQQRGQVVVALDWGIDAPVRFLTRGEIRPVEIFGYESFHGPDPGFRERASHFIAPGIVFIAHSPEDTVFKGRLEALKTLAWERGLRLKETAHIRERSGRLLYIILQLE